MASELAFDVFKVTQWKDGCVYKTKLLKRVWVPADIDIDKDSKSIAQQHGGDILAATGHMRDLDKNGNVLREI